MQNENRILDTLFRSLAYMLGGMFLIVTSSSVGQVFGWIFVGFAFFLAISASVGMKWLSDLTHRGHKWFGLGLFIATVARVFITAIDTHSFSYVVLAFVFGVLIIVALLCQIFKNAKARSKEKGTQKP